MDTPALYLFGMQTCLANATGGAIRTRPMILRAWEKPH